MENDELIMAVVEYTVMYEVLKDEMRVSKRLMDELSTTANRMYVQGYERGHSDTVEGCYTLINRLDTDTYFSEEVEQALKEGESDD